MALFFIILLTAILVLDCAVLALLVLIQLPKKDAGAGVAFGGAATDALFGAGSGNVLTKITKYAAGIFICLSILLSAMQSRFHDRAKNVSDFTSPVMPSLPALPTPATPATSATPPGPAVPATSGSNRLSATPVESTNLPTPATPAHP